MKTPQATAPVVFACTPEQFLRGKASIVEVSASKSGEATVVDVHVASSVAMGKFCKAKIVDVGQQGRIKTSSEPMPSLALQRLAAKDPRLALTIAGGTIAQQRRAIKALKRAIAQGAGDLPAFDVSK